MRKIKIFRRELMKSKKGQCRYTSIGGQALIEGIMMRGPQKTSVCCRTPSGEISTDFIDDKRVKDKIKILGWPVIRGIVNLIESFKLGYKALMISADKSMEEEIKTEENQKGIPAPLMAVLTTLAAIAGVAIAAVLFMYLPAWLFDTLLSDVCQRIFGSVSIAKPVFEGILKMALFIAYIAAVALMKDIKRMFMYHGAEHKTIFCYEHGDELTVENVRKYRRFHPRCGTSFMVLMLIISIVVSSIVGIIFSRLLDASFRPLWIAVKILLIPVICGFGYELIKFCGRHDNKLTHIISAPGMWMQRLTTKEPDDSMIEVAIAALKEVLPGDGSDMIEFGEKQGK